MRLKNMSEAIDGEQAKSHDHESTISEMELRGAKPHYY